MKQHLTVRELTLLGVLAVILLDSCYVMPFYIPMTAELKHLEDENELCRTQLTATQQRTKEKQRIEREMRELFAQPEPPVEMPAYDNLQQVMFELNAILVYTKEYSLSFGTVDADKNIVTDAFPSVSPAAVMHRQKLYSSNCMTACTAVCWTICVFP